MASAIFNVLFKIAGTVVQIFTAPITALLVGFFPDFAVVITNFNQSVTTFVGGGIAWFSNLIPPVTRATILMYLGIVVAYYAIAFQVHLVLKIVTIIKNLKIW